MRSIVLAGMTLLATQGLAGQVRNLEVRGLHFRGNRAIDSYVLAASIATTNSSWIARAPLLGGLGLGERRVFNEAEFRRDVLRIVLLYKWNGYFDVAVDTAVKRTDTDIDITFRITEGRPTRLVMLDVSGLGEVPDRERIMRDLPLEVGDVFSRSELAASEDSIAVRLRNSGYPSATVTSEGRADSVTREARITLLVSPGAPAVFGETSVSGTSEVDSGFVASMVTARAGRPYRLDEIYRSQRALYGTDLFRFATVAIDSSRFQVGDTLVPLRIEVLEGRTHRVRASTGYATNDCFRAGAGWTARNFLGNGRVVDVSGRLSKIGVGSPFGFGAENSVCSALAEDTIGSRSANYGIDVALRRYGFLSPDNTLILSLFSERRSEYKVYMREEIGASIALTRETVRRIPVTLGYRISYGLTEANEVSFCQFFNACVGEDIAQLRQRRVLTTLNASASRERVNNLLDPSRGSLISTEVGISSRFLGSSRYQQFVRVVGDASGYTQLSRGVVLAGHLRAGAIFAPRISLAEGTGNFVPPDQRFYAGGPNDVRGYDRNELGPVVYVVARDSVNGIDGDLPFNPSAARVAATGGDRLAVANLELRLPSPVMSDRLRFAAFVDAGTVWSQGVTDPRVRVTPGFGVRMNSPLGPIRFDIGYNPYQLEPGSVYTNTEDGDLILLTQGFVRDRGRRWTLHFSIGNPF